MWSFWLALQIGYNFGVHFAIQREGGIGVFPCLHEISGHESFEYLTRVKVLTDSPPPSLTMYQTPTPKYDRSAQNTIIIFKVLYKISILKYGRTNKFNHSRLLTVEQSQQNKSKSTLTFVWEFWKEMWWHFFENSCDDIVIFQFIRWWNLCFSTKEFLSVWTVDLNFCTPSFLKKKMK